MTKYCMICGAKKSEHLLYTVQGILYMDCKKTGCQDECGDFVSKKKLNTSQNKEMSQ